MPEHTNAPRLAPIVAMVVIVAIGVAYLLFLAATWTQLQRDRTAAFAKVDEILDRIPREKVIPGEVEAEGSAS